MTDPLDDPASPAVPGTVPPSNPIFGEAPLRVTVTLPSGMSATAIGTTVLHQMDRGRIWEAYWEDDDSLPAPIVIKESLYSPFGQATLAEREAAAYRAIANLPVENPLRDRLAVCYGMALGNQEDPAYFVLERLGLSVAHRMRQMTPGVVGQDAQRVLPLSRGGLARNILRDGLAGVLALSDAGVAIRDPNPENILLPQGDTDGGSRLKLIDFGHAYLLDPPADGRVPTNRSLLGMRFVQPTAVLQGGLHVGLIDDAYGIAASAYIVASGGHTPYVRRAGDRTTRVEYGLSEDVADCRLWDLDIDDAHLESCDQMTRVLIRRILSMSGQTRMRCTEDLAGTRHEVHSWITDLDTLHRPELVHEWREPTAIPAVTPEADARVDMDYAVAIKYLASQKYRGLPTLDDFLPPPLPVPPPPPAPPPKPHPLGTRPAKTTYAGLVLAAISVWGVLVGWPSWYQSYTIMPWTLPEFTLTQHLVVWMSTGLAITLGTFLFGQLIARRPWLAAPAAVVVALACAGVGLASAWAFAAASESSSLEPLDCSVPVASTAVSPRSICVEQEPGSGWQFRGAESSGRPTGGLYPSGAGLWYRYKNDLDACVTAWVVVSQSSTEPNVGGTTFDGHKVELHRAGTDGVAVRSSAGRHIWLTYSTEEGSGDRYSRNRIYVLVTRGQSIGGSGAEHANDGAVRLERGVGLTRVWVQVSETGCAAEFKEELGGVPTALLAATQAVDVSALESEFVQRHPEARLDGPSSEALTVPISRILSPQWAGCLDDEPSGSSPADAPPCWRTDDDSQPWLLGARLRLGDLGGSPTFADVRVLAGASTMVGQRAGPAQGWREGDPSPEHGDDTFRRFQAILPLDRCWTLEVTLRGYDFYGTSDATVRSEALNQLLNGLALYNSKDYSFTQVHPKRGKKLGITPCDLVVPTSDSVTPRWPGWDEEQKSETGKNLMWLAGVEVGLGEPITSSVVAQVEVQSATPDTDPLSWDNTLPGPAEGWFVDEYLPTDGSQGHRQFFAVVEHEGHWLLGVNLFGDIHAQATYDEALVELLTGITLFGQKPLKE